MGICVYLADAAAEVFLDEFRPVADTCPEHEDGCAFLVQFAYFCRILFVFHGVGRHDHQGKSVLFNLSRILP